VAGVGSSGVDQPVLDVPEIGAGVGNEKVKSDVGRVCA
jgi:hypothetical protein